MLSRSRRPQDLRYFPVLLFLGDKQVTQLVEKAAALGRHVLLVDLRQLAIKLLLALIEIAWNLDGQEDVQIPFAAGAMVRHTAPRNADDIAALHPRLDRVRDGAVEGRYFDVSAQSCLADSDRHLADEMVPFTTEQRMF